jgi:hypothetical protein
VGWYVVGNSSEGTDSDQSPLSANSKGEYGGRKIKHQEDLISFGTSKSKDVPHDLVIVRCRHPVGNLKRTV